MTNRTRPRVTAVILAYQRRAAVGRVLDRLRSLPVDEIIVFDSGSTDGTADEVARRKDPHVQLIRSENNVGLAGRNEAARRARGDLLLMLDDDSYPLPGSIEHLVEAFVSSPRLGVAGGFVRDVDEDGRILKQNEIGTFDWFFRGGRATDPSGGIETFFFPEGACMIRKEAYAEVGGFFEPFFITVSEIDLATRMLGAGWDVRYFPEAHFDHMKAPEGRVDHKTVLRYRVRNQIWYFYRHFPAGVAWRRIAGYLLFDLVECTYRGALVHWAKGVVDAWKSRDRIAQTRAPLTRDVLRRAELDRGRIHLRLLVLQLVCKLRARTRSMRAQMGGGR